jgi:opacity protein-like surface antigen
MKKVSLLAAVSFIAAQGAIANPDATAPAAMCPNGFKGFFLGGNVGLGTGGGKQKLTETIAGTVPAETYSIYGKPVGLRGVDGGINVGYNYVFGNKFGLGLEFVANWANSSGKVIATNLDGGANFNAPGVMTARAKLENSLQLRANFSYVIANLVAPKVILGWDNSQWKQTFSSNMQQNTTFAFKKSHRYNGFLWGLGVDFLAMKHVILGVEYTGTIASGKKHTVIDPTTKNVYATSFKPQYNKIALTAKIIY